MTKIIASVSKKVPVPGVPFSNQQFGGSLEVELPDGVTDEQLQARFQELHALLAQSVEAEIATAVEAARQAQSENHAGVGAEARREDPPSRRPESFRDEGFQGGRRGGSGQGRYPGDSPRDNRDFDARGRDGYRPGYRREGGSRPGGYDNNRGGGATQAQVKAVFGIAKASGLDRRDLLERVEEQFGVRRIEDLNVRQASTLIESLKAS